METDSLTVSSVIWPLALQALGFAVVFAEVLIPSFGVLTFVALALGVWSWYFIVTELPVGGIVAFAVADAILIPIAIRYGFRYLGRSPVSHRSDVGTGSGLENTTLALAAHVGREVPAETGLRPSGKIRIDGELHEARTAGEFVQQGALVRIVAVRGAEFTVEKI